MPIYTFKDLNTGEVFEHSMKIAELDQFRNDNPHLQTIITAPMICDPVRVGVTKVDGGFKEVLQKVHERTPGSRLNVLADI